MASTTDIPVVIDPAAAERVAELGMQNELQRILDHAKQTLPGLHKLHVAVDYRGHMGEPDALTVWAHREDPPCEPEADPTDWDFGTWMIDTFSPEVNCWFGLITIYEAPDGR
jgi:hypothetical protein